MRDDKLRKNLEEIRDEIVDEDLELEKKGQKLSCQQEKKIYSNVESKKGMVLRFFNRKGLSIAAAAVLLLVLIPFIRNSFMAGSPNKSQENMAHSPDEKTEEAGSENVNKSEGDKEQGLGADNFDLGALPQGQKIIYTYSYSLRTTDFKAAQESLNKLIESTKSYVESAEIFKNGRYDKGHGVFTIRVHKDQANSFKDSLKNIASIVSQSVTSENKTKYYRDLERDKELIGIRLERYKELLKSAKNIEDILKIEDFIAKAQSDLAYLNKDISDIDRDVNYQTFNIEILEVDRISETSKDENSLLAKMKDAFSDSIDYLYYFLESLLLFIIVNWILIIFIILVVLVIFRKIRRSK